MNILGETEIKVKGEKVTVQITDEPGVLIEKESGRKFTVREGDYNKLIDKTRGILPPPEEPVKEDIPDPEPIRNPKEIVEQKIEDHSPEEKAAENIPEHSGKNNNLATIILAAVLGVTILSLLLGAFTGLIHIGRYPDTSNTGAIVSEEALNKLDGIAAEDAENVILIARVVTDKGIVKDITLAYLNTGAKTEAQAEEPAPAVEQTPVVEEQSESSETEAAEGSEETVEGEQSETSETVQEDGEETAEDETSGETTPEESGN